MIRVLVLSADPDGPSVRHRWVRPAPLLEAGGVGVEVLRLPDDGAARAEAFAEAAGADVAVLQRRLLRTADFARLLRSVRRLAYDFDDAMPHRDSFRGRPLSSARAARFVRTCAAADAVLAGSEVLAEMARACRPRAVFVAPTPVDVAAYGPEPARRADGAPFRVGWIGSRSTLPYLALVAKPLARALAGIPGARLVVVGDRAPELPGVPLEFVPWSEAAEAEALRGMDAGIMPLTDDPWSRGKCGFKLLQYAATGLPAVASPVGANTSIVEDGRTGFLAADDDAWERAIRVLAADGDLRRRMGAAARRAAESRWSLRVLVPPLAAFLRAVGSREDEAAGADEGEGRPT